MASSLWAHAVSTPGKPGPKANLPKGLHGVKFRGWETLRHPVHPSVSTWEAESHGQAATLREHDFLGWGVASRGVCSGANYSVTSREHSVRSRLVGAGVSTAVRGDELSRPLSGLEFRSHPRPASHRPPGSLRRRQTTPNSYLSGESGFPCKTQAMLPLSPPWACSVN